MTIWTEGTLTTVDGSPGTGKSNWAMVLAQRALKKDPKLEIISNVLLEYDIPRYNYANEISKFLWYLTRIKRSLVIWDETGGFGTSGYGSDSKKIGQMVLFVKLMRKFGSSVIWIDQTFYGTIPRPIRCMTTYSFTTPSKGMLEFYTIKRKGDDVIRILQEKEPNNRLTAIPYYHKSMAGFKFDLPKDRGIFHLIESISNVPPDKIPKETEKWLSLGDLDPPKDERFSDVLHKRERKERGPEKILLPLETKRKIFEDPDLLEFVRKNGGISTRIIVYGILQENPQYSTKKIAGILKKSEETIRIYRNEYNGKRKIKNIEKKEEEENTPPPGDP